MDLRDLAYFETIAELGHLGQAAIKLNRSQPALSKSIQRLEESLGVRLFMRDGRRIKLTPVGERLLARSKPLRQSVEQTRREIHDMATGVQGHVRLGCAASMIEFVIPEACARLMAQAPDITFSLVVGQDDVLRQSLLDGVLDLVLCPLNPQDPELVIHSLIEDEAVVVARHDHPVFDGPLELAQLSQYRWLLPPATVSGRRWIDHVMQSHQLPAPVVQIETNVITLSPQLIARTGLLSFLTRQSLAYGEVVARLREVPIAQTTLKRNVGVGWRRDGYLSPATLALVEILKHFADDASGVSLPSTARFFSGLAR